jgi:hypothetical protein
MAEFKKLSDVEVIAEPTESANVLIEENGVIKKAPKTAVGGAGGGAYIICLDGSVSTHNEDIIAIHEKVKSGVPIVAIYNESSDRSRVYTNCYVTDWAISFYGNGIYEEDSEEMVFLESLVLNNAGNYYYTSKRI